MEIVHQEKYVRKQSVVRKTSALEELYRFTQFPVFIGATQQEPERDIYADMIWDICTETGCIQLRNLLPPELIYSGYHSEALGGIWREHHNEFRDFCDKFVSNNILEIGGSNGYLSKLIIESNKNVEGYTIVEPNPTCESSGKLKVIDGFFDTSLACSMSQKFDCVVHSHTLEHAYDPLDFVSGISEILKIGGTHIFTVPNLKSYMMSGFTNTLNFEHTYFLTEELIFDIMTHLGFSLIDKKEFKNHSLFFAFEKVGGASNKLFKNCYTENKQLFLDYITYHKNEIQRINDEVKRHNGEIYLFGGHIFSQFLINFGLDTSKLVQILDNSDVKQGKRLYGTEFMIQKPEKLLEGKNPALILKAGQYQQEIINQIQSIRKDCLIIE